MTKPNETEPSQKPHRKGTRRGRVLLVLGSLLACALLSEAAVRVYSAVSFPRMMRVDDVLGWRHLPSREKSFTNEDGEKHLCQHDEHGHRPLPDALRSPARTTNVLLLGDSFTEAIQVASEETVHALLAEGDPRLNVMNAAVGGYSTVQQFMYLRNEGEPFAPDLVLLIAYENDLTDNCLSYSPGIGPRPWAKLEGDVVQMVEDYDDGPYLQFVVPIPFAGPLIRHSYLFYAFNDRVWRKLKRKQLSAVELEDWSALQPETTHPIFLGMVDRMHELAKERGSEFVVALAPSLTTIKAGGGGAWHTEVAAHAAAKGFHFVSLLPALSDPGNGRCYFEKDIHWTKVGHAVAADVILPVVQQALAARK